MSWSFETDPAYQAQLDWVDQFVRNEVEPLDQAVGGVHGFAGAPSSIKRCGPVSARTAGVWS